ncbi:heterokaryon incompatibility protein-domain-containing protein [Bipolaris maydis]|nr:heterokaryon incompatibility protein-domain-containing protein [Bipolaris maydis]
MTIRLLRLLRLDPEKCKWILESFSEDEIPVYAILSHTWGRSGDEVQFEDIQGGQKDYGDTSKPGYEKLRFCQEKVEKDGLAYFWIDTCCINKSSSAELQRSLASMFYWYRSSARCYVHLSDVSDHEFTEGSYMRWKDAFSRSRWFKRSWTLQELIAPTSVFFFSKEKTFLGSKKSLISTISAVTQIPIRALEGPEVSYFTVDERFSWTQDRSATIPEDVAYSLMGIFDVGLPMMYADGDYDKRKNVALKALQKAIDEKNVNYKEPQHVIRIGGASWSELMRLNEKDLQELDSDLQEFQKWILDEWPKEVNASTVWTSKLGELSEATGGKMKELLAKYRVGYDDLSHLRATMQSWEQPWARFSDERVPVETRVQALVENRWYWTATEKNENVFTCITAARTL